MQLEKSLLESHLREVNLGVTETDMAEVFRHSCKGVALTFVFYRLF